MTLLADQPFPAGKLGHIGSIEFARVDETHEQISHPRAIPRFIEQRVLAMQNRLL
jgi:hypothetical protein